MSGRNKDTRINADNDQKSEEHVIIQNTIEQGTNEGAHSQANLNGSEHIR